MKTLQQTFKMGQRLMVLAVVFMMSAGAKAEDDFGIWTELSVEKSFNKKFSVSGGFDFRAEQNVTRAARYAVNVGADYKLTKFLKFGAGYMFMYDRSAAETKVDYKKDGITMNGYDHDHAFWRNKHRLFAELTGKLNVGRFSFSLRERYQYTHYMADSCVRDKYRGLVTEDYAGGYWPEPNEDGMFYAYDETVMDAKPKKGKHYLRSRLQVEYDIKGLPLTPYASYEFSNNLSDGFHLDKQRLTVGADYKIKKKHTLTLAYIHENGADDDSGNMHAVSLGYKFKF